MSDMDGDEPDAEYVDEELADLLAETYGQGAYEVLLASIKSDHHHGDTATLLHGAWLGVRAAFHYVMASAVQVDETSHLVVDPNMSDHVLFGLYTILGASYPSRRPPGH